MGYEILTQEGGQEPKEYPVEKPTNKSAHALQKLRVRNAALSDAVRERVAVSEGFSDWILEEGDEDDPLKGTQLKKPDLSEKEYIERAAQVLFPRAPIAENEDYIDRSVFREAEKDFLSLIERPSNVSSRPSTDLASLTRLGQSIESVMQKVQNISSTAKTSQE